MAQPKLLWIDAGKGMPDGLAKLPFAGRFDLTPVKPAELGAADLSGEWDVICFDFDYPDMADLKLIPAAKCRWPSSPILMLTLQNSADIALWALRSRVFDLLVKPLTSHEVAQALERVADAIRARRSQIERRPQATTARLPAETRYHPYTSPARRLQAAVTHIGRYYLRPIPESEVALLCDMSPSRFCREFRAAFGVTFGEYLANHRLSHAKRLLANPMMPVADVAVAVGFSDPSYFTRVFRKYEGVSPSEFRAATIFEGKTRHSAAR